MPMIIDETVLHSSSLAKYRAAFLEYRAHTLNDEVEFLV